MPIQKQISFESLDSLSANISKINAILNLLTSDGESLDGFCCSHSTIMSTIWLLCDLADELEKEVKEIYS